MQAPGKAKAVVLFAHGHGAYLLHELLHIPVSSLTLVFVQRRDLALPRQARLIQAICSMALLQRLQLSMQAAGMSPQYSKSWVETLNGAGFSVCGIDQQGCGFSEGLECYVERFHYYVDDVLQFARCATQCCCL